MADDLKVGLRVQPKLDEALAAVRQLRAEIQAVNGAGATAGTGAGGSSSAGAAQAQQAVAKANTEAAAAADQATVAQNRSTSAQDDAAEAARKAAAELKKEQDAVERLASSLAPAATAADNLVRVEQQLDAALAKGLITQERHAQLLGAAKQLYDQDAVAVQRLGAELQQTGAQSDRLGTAVANLDAALAKGLITQERHAVLLQQAQQRYAGAAISANQYRNAMRQLPAQITDVATSLASGMPLYLVAIQQGGQIRDSFGGIGTAARGLMSIFTPLRLLVGGVAAAIASIGVAAYQGARESETFGRSIILSGNAAGTTAGQLNEMARRIDGVVGTQANAAAGLAKMAESGRVANSSLERFTTVAIQLERDAGQAIDTTVKHFTELAKAPVDASLKLNEQYHYLTTSVYEQIKALEEQGRTEEAGEVAQRAYADAMATRAVQLNKNLGVLERAWRGIKDAAAEAWDAMLGIGRRETAQQQLEGVTRRIEALRATQGNGGFDSNAAGAAFGRGGAGSQARSRELAALQAQQAALQESLRLEQRGAELTAQRAKQTERLATWEKDGDQFKSNAVKREEALNKERTRGQQLLRDGLITQKDYDDRMKAIAAKLKDPKGAQGPSDFRLANADATVAMAELKATFGALQANIKAGDAIIVQALQDGNVSIGNAYQARLAQIQLEADQQRKLLSGQLEEIDAALGKAKNSAESAPLRQKRVELQAQIRLVDANLSEESRKLSQWKFDQEKQLAAISAKLRVEVSAVTGQFDRKAVEDQLRAQMDSDFKATGRIGDATERQAAQDRLQLLLQAGTAQSEFNFRLGEAQRLQSALGAQEADLQRQVQSGQLSQIEAEGRLRALRADQVPALQAIVEQLQAVRDALPPEAAATLANMSTQIKQVQTTTAAATPTVVGFGTQIRTGLIDSLGDAVKNVGSDWKTLPDVVKASLRQVLLNILSSGIKRALTDALTPTKAPSAPDSSSPSLWSAIGTLVKGLFNSSPGNAAGGPIVGPGTGTSDSIPALVDGRRPIRVANGEFIQPQRAVQHYGGAFMEAVRTLRLPRPSFAFGGLVSAYRGATRFASGGPIVGPGAGGQAQVPNVVLNVTNNGTPQRVESQDVSMQGKDMVVGLVLGDLRDGGPISRALESRGSRG
jgi:phage-related minor tail protein